MKFHIFKITLLSILLSCNPLGKGTNVNLPPASNGGSGGGSSTQSGHCNPCESFRKSAGSCQSIVKTCSKPHPNKCGKTLVENFDHIIRMANFTG